MQVDVNTRREFALYALKLMGDGAQFYGNLLFLGTMRLVISYKQMCGVRTWSTKV